MIKGSKRSLLAVAALALSCVAIVGGVFAYMTSSEAGVNKFTIGEVVIEASEPHYPTTDANRDGVPDACELLIPLQEVPKDPRIRNTGKNDAIVFFKVTAPVETLTLMNDDGTTTGPALGDLFWYKMSSDAASVHRNHFSPNWIELVDQEEGANKITSKRTYVFGYHIKLKPGESTANLFDKFQNKKYSSTTITGGEHEDIIIDSYAIQAEYIQKNGAVLNTSGELSAADLSYIYSVYVKQAGE